MLFSLGLTLGQVAYAGTHALLIGVSGYPSLPESRRLRGPANDVQIMHAGLLQAGVSAIQIRVLADGVVGSSGLPTRKAILDALHTLAEKAQPKDWVIVYFSGHGSQQPQFLSKSAYIEPDGFNEIFLPYDIGKWDGSKMAVQGALVDDEIGKAMDAISNKGARIWAIFDTCHAAGMSKAGLGDCAPEGCQVARYVSPSALGVPEQTLRLTKPRSAKQPAASEAALNNTATKGPVLFFASQKDEPAAEEPLPDLLAASEEKSTNPLAGVVTHPKRYFGLFTYLIVQAMSNWNGNLSDLANHVALRYKTRPYPTPLFEGPLGDTSDLFVTRQIGLKKTSIRP